LFSIPFFTNALFIKIGFAYQNSMKHKNYQPAAKLSRNATSFNFVILPPMCVNKGTVSKV